MEQIDTSMYGQIQPLKLESPVNMLMQGMQLKQAQNQNRLADLAFAEKEREVGADRALAQAMTDGGDVAQSLFKQGYGKQGLAFQKDQRAQEKANLEAAKERIGLFGQVAGAAKDQASWDAGIATLKQAGFDVSKTPAQFDPNLAAQAQQQAMTAAQQVDQVWKAKKFDLDVQQFGETKRHNRSTEGAAFANIGLRKQEIGQKERELGMGGKAPAGYRWKPDGSLEPIPGGPAEKESAGTEGERTASGYGLRMQEAEKIIGSVAAKDAKSQKPGAIEAVTGPGMIANLTSSSNRQQYRQAQEDWVRAKLRKESGAVIGEEEMKREIMTYFPQPGDKAEVIAQKADARKVAMEAMKTSAGKAGKNLTAPTGGIKILGFE
jgi:hypothetical protein